MWVSALIVVLVGLLGTFLAVLFCGGAEKYIVQLFGLEEGQKYEALKFLGIGMGGVLLALQAVIANKRAKAMGDAADAQASAADAQARATEEQATANKNTEQGQRQERLKNAIEHLGYSSDSVRLGGAYELFHLAEDEDTAEDKKDTKDLRQTALDILCAHIRRTTSEEKYRAKHKSKPSEEIQSLLTLLFVQEHKVFTECDINISLQGSCLNGSNLRQARLEKAHLEGAQLHGAHLTEARLHEAHLEGAQLYGAHLTEAQLHEAHLEGARLHEAHLEGAQLHEAYLEGAQLHEAYLEGAQLHGAHLERAQLHGADLTEAQLHGAHLERAQLHGADLTEAQLHGAHLERAQLHGADLGAARLHGAHLGAARLHGAHLGAARLHGAHLGGAQLQGAYLGAACLQGAYLVGAQLQGASSDLRYSKQSFEASINKRIDKESELFGVIFAGGLTQEAVDCMCNGLSDGAANELREKLEAHIEKLESNKLRENSGAIRGTYTKEAAAQWIAEYKPALSAVDDNIRPASRDYV